MTANLKRWLMVSLVVLFMFGLVNIACNSAKEEPPAEQEEMMQADTTQVEEMAPADTTAAEPAPEQ
ncbi:hypothetical protein A2V82_08925 [candidate division KSB1 bacterium RBG_16_48_16]|nr:MAG: hypothetical protein A2V82_08925 [candidate division KSB1 bacterium RBG_16_48_16]